MSAHAVRPIQLFEVFLIIVIAVLAWPITTNCRAAGQGCTPPPNAKGEIVRPTTTAPFVVVLLEGLLRQDIDFAYRTGTSVERPVIELKAAPTGSEPSTQDQPAPSPIVSTHQE